MRFSIHGLHTTEELIFLAIILSMLSGAGYLWMRAYQERRYLPFQDKFLYQPYRLLSGVRCIIRPDVKDKMEAVDKKYAVLSSIINFLYLISTFYFDILFRPQYSTDGFGFAVIVFYVIIYYSLSAWRFFTISPLYRFAPLKK